MGAWIEIDGRKIIKAGTPVAPLVGAWIEIYSTALKLLMNIVAPLVGAWIEILTWLWQDGMQGSRSPRGSVD